MEQSPRSPPQAVPVPAAPVPAAGGPAAVPPAPVPASPVPAAVVTIELAVLDAPVLARGALPVLLLRLAAAGAYDPVWSDPIHAEWTRLLHQARPDIPAERLRQRRVELERAFPAANVAPSREAQEEVLAHCTTPAERRSAHILATALSARAAVIVTDDSFRLIEVMAKLWHDTAVLTPAAWCLELLDRREEEMLAGLRAHRAASGHDTVEAWLAALAAAPFDLSTFATRLAGLRDRL